ncbi:ABC transporter substrate-binding protein [Paenibacillus oceani]|uniref:Extracellular solute-binding protein n=1 Tax=Paenibacillus oceani TaxID=2772510 RepID=A0A927CEM9_9BACL|nr:extracellular solute-binding protein [Paenibacillus oceani]MBD2864400.1 extracellular solute-binding protein [Paenibacillus oceani]
MNKRSCIIPALTVLAIVSGGCSQATTNDMPKQEPVRNDPVTLKLFNQGAYLFPELQQKVEQVIKAKYPHITLQYITGAKLEETVASGEVPDLFFTFWTQIPRLAKDFDIVEDMTPLIQKHQIDLNRFSPNFMEDVKKASGKGELLALPYYANFFAIYYNKDLFDRFAVPYPTDGMTWDSMIDLAKRMSRIEGNTAYPGLDPSSLLWVSLQFGAFHIDPATNKASIHTEVWKKPFELMKTILTLPGNEINTASHFIKNQNVAMLLNPNILDQMVKVNFNWDLVQYPILKENPNKYPAISVHSLFVSKTSKHKDQAMQVIDVFTSEEVQMWLSRQGKGSTLKSEAIKAAFGADVPLLKNKNIAGALKSQPLAMPAVHQLETSASTVTNKYFGSYLSGEMDLNSALRLADEEVNKLIEAEMQKK